MGIILRKRDWVKATLASGVQTASTTSTAVDGFAGAQNVIFQLAVTAASGTSPTLDVVVEDSIDGTNWHTIATFTQKTTTGTQAVRVASPFGDSVRARSTITGTTPSFTFAIVAQAEGDM